MAGQGRYARQRWKEDRESELWSFVDEKVKSGGSVTSALKEYGKKHNMSWLTARWKYYQIRKENTGAVPGAPVRVPLEARLELTPGAPVQAPNVAGVRGEVLRPEAAEDGEDDFLGYLSQAVRSAGDAGQDIVSFVKGLSRLALMSKEAAKLRDELDAAKSKAGGWATALDGACGVIRGWLNLSQVDRVASLKDFSKSLETVLDSLDTIREALRKVS